MDRRNFLKLLSASVAVAAAPKFIFDYGKNLWRTTEASWEDVPMSTIGNYIFKERWLKMAEANALTPSAFDIFINFEDSSGAQRKMKIEQVNALLKGRDAIVVNGVSFKGLT